MGYKCNRGKGFEYLDEIYPYIVNFINEIKETNYVCKIMFNCIVLIFNNYKFKASKVVDEETFSRSKNIMETFGRWTEDLIEVFCEFLQGINRIIEKIKCNDFLSEN